MARVDPDLEQALLEPNGPPNIAASGGELIGGRPFRVALVAVGVEYVPLQGSPECLTISAMRRRRWRKASLRISSSVSRRIE